MRWCPCLIYGVVRGYLECFLIRTRSDPSHVVYTMGEPLDNAPFNISLLYGVMRVDGQTFKISRTNLKSLRFPRTTMSGHASKWMHMT